jgi:2,4-dienoyl-CoA reductase-like NADH-dependent reductase (Old Yellow Enzyme family)
MSILFTPTKIGKLSLSNRIVRSATAERLADTNGYPLPALKQLYSDLARGGVGLIITGHMYIHPSGKAHPEMTGIYSDDLIPSLSELAQAAHQGSSKIVVQINHGGLQCDQETVPDLIGPSAQDNPIFERPVRAMTDEEILATIDAYAQAAARVKESGFDGVQIHAAHGYLISQFLSPFINQRNDKWGGNHENRLRFFREVCKSVRAQVGADFPMMTKLGMEDGIEGGLTPLEGAEIVAELKSMGLDAVEISGGFKSPSTKKGIRNEQEEAYFLPNVKLARKSTDLPILAVGGYRSKSVMERVLESGEADFISLCRPLISEPDLPNLFNKGNKDKSRCISSNNCWPTEMGVGIACKCPHDKVPQ